MATNFKNSAGTDLESIFEAGTGSLTTNFLNSSSQDLGKIFLPVSSGSAASATGFKNSAGTDLGSVLCAKGTDFKLTKVSAGSHCCAESCDWEGSCWCNSYCPSYKVSANRYPFTVVKWLACGRTYTVNKAISSGYFYAHLDCNKGATTPTVYVTYNGKSYTI